MTKLFAFAGSGPPPVDYPTTLNPTGYWKDFASIPWAGTASGGTSGSHTFDANTASVGASFGSHASADLDGASDYLRDNTDAASTLISVSAFTLQWIAEFDTASAADASPDNEPGLFVDYANGYFRVTYSTSGVRACIYPSGNTAYVALATGTKACIQCVYDGATLKIRVNGGAWQSVASANIVNLANNPTIGVNYNATKHIDGRIAQFLSWDTALNDGVLDLLYSDAQSYYGVP